MFLLSKLNKLIMILTKLIKLFVEPIAIVFFRKSRRSLPPRVQRKIARKPFVQIKCSQELRDAIMCKKADSVMKKADPIVIDD